ncbi:unnamed protein product [Rhizoctonia solani]|uniref:Major facilitator superfamily (MFS) profile domain-containing protein n=1 Tax=Rhizoctonia solani TaxID=456999 RepID=A0A8H3GTL9_9AGAM|nr:unnamed protein product [Rhizoctonia solani]
MSQTATCEIELLDALPHLETGTPLDRAKSLYAQTPDVGTELLDAEYFSRNAPDNCVDATGSSHTLANSMQPNEISGIRIGKIFIEDKVLYLAGACMGAFAVGLNDTATGANLPSFQAHYHLSYETVSLVFLAGLGGYLVSCMLNSVLQNTIGTRNVLLMAGSLYAGGSLLISFAPPFPVVMAGLCLMGLGGGFYEACLTSVVSHVSMVSIAALLFALGRFEKFENSRFMNILYAFFGLGALVSPFIIGALAKAGAAWKLYYWFPFSLATLVTICHFVLFKHYVIPSDHEEAPEFKSVREKFKQVMHMPITWIGIVLTILSFAIANVLSNWLTSYLIDVKGSDLGVSRYQLSMLWAAQASLSVEHFSPYRLSTSTKGTSARPYVRSNGLTLGCQLFGIQLGRCCCRWVLLRPEHTSLKGIVVSITLGLGLVGSTLGPLIFGIVAGKVSPGLRILPPVIIVLACLSALFFWTIPPRRKVD